MTHPVLRKLVNLALLTLLMGLAGLVPAGRTHAEAPGDPRSKTQWIVYHGGVEDDFQLRRSGDGRIEPVTAAEMRVADLAAEGTKLSAMLKKGHLRLALEGFFALQDDSTGMDTEASWINVVRRVPGYVGPVLDGGYFVPGEHFNARANKVTVMSDWLDSLDEGASRTGPEGYRHAWRDPTTHAAFMLANQAILRIAYRRVTDNGLKFTLWEADANRIDAVGASIFNGALLALTKYAAAGMDLTGHPAAMVRPNDYIYAYDADEFRDLSESGPVPKAMLALSQTWAEPWAGLSPYEDKTDRIVVGPVTGAMMSLLSNSGPGAIRTVLDDPFPYRSGGNGRPAKEWLGWLDGQIRKSGNTPKPWDQHRQFVAERGFAGAYVTALADMIAIPRRAAEWGSTRPMPEMFRDGEYLDLVYQKHPCQDFSFSLSNPVQEVAIDLPEVASRCIRIRWTGEGFGPNFTGPPVLLSVKGEGMTPEDYDDILMAATEGEMVGLTVVDQPTRNAVKYWSLPYRVDYEGGEWMTLGFANVAPNVVDTRPRKLKVTLGPGLTSGSGKVSTVADASKAGSTETCRPQTITSPELYGAAPHPLGATADGSFTLLAGLSSLTKNSPNSDAAIQVAMCTGETLGSALNARNETGLGLSRNNPDESRESCLMRMHTLVTQMTKRPAQVEFAGIELTPKAGADLGKNTMSVPVEAEVQIFDPTLAKARQTSQVDYRGNPRVHMEGLVTFQIRTDTRIRGRVDLKVPPRAVLDQADCDGTASGSMNFVFDIVAAMPFNETAYVLPPDTLSVMDPVIWAMMTPAQKQQAISEGAKARAEAGAASGAAGTILGTTGCDCSCAEYNDPSRRQVCSAECLDFQATAPQCVIEREVDRGRSRSEVTELLNACPTDCSALSRADPLCRESLSMITEACAADIVTEADKACYLKLFTQDMPEPMKSQMGTEMRKQLAGMDQDALRLIIRPQLDAYKEQGKTCPVN